MINTKNDMQIPFVDLYAQYLTIKDDVDNAIRKVIEKSSFIRGPFVDNFEEIFASLVGQKYCVSCANGTDSLHIAMKALGVKPGDEIIAPAHSWISTTETITQSGAKVVFCDTIKETYNIDPNAIKDKITPRTVGIIPVHLFGHAADMTQIMKIAHDNGLWVIEDCAQAHLARHKGRLVGSFGIAASYSFYPGKNLGAMGDAGAITTNDKVLAEKMAMYARHGGITKGDHQIEGINSRMDGLQAAILTVKIPHLLRWTALRQKNARLYTDLLKRVPEITVPYEDSNSEHVWHLYVVKHAKRDELAKFLKNIGIQTSINYPVALPFLPAYKRYNHVPSDFPNAYANQSEVLSLPMYPELNDEQIRKIVSCIAEFDK